MSAPAHATAATVHVDDIPMPVVTLSRWCYVLCLCTGFLLQQPLLTTLVLGVALLPFIGGREWNLFAHLGRRLYGRKLATAPREDRRLIRFNNLILVVMLAVAQPLFAFDLGAAGWALALAVAAAAGAALAGDCVGCVLYYQLKLNRHRLFGAKS